MTLYKGNQAIENLYIGNQAISEVYYGSQLVYSSGVWLTVNTTPSNATVIFNTTGKVDGNRIRVKKGTSVSYTVSANGYYTQTGSVVVNNDHIINIGLEQQFYQDGEVLFESGAGGTNSSITPKTTGVYEIICIAGGGGGAIRLRYQATTNMSRKASGGSGSGFRITAKLQKDSAYKITIGKGGAGTVSDTPNTWQRAGNGTDSSFGTSMAYAGGGGAIYNNNIQEGGTAGAVPTLALTPISTIFNSAGNAGLPYDGDIKTTVAGGAALYGSYGKGGDSTLANLYEGTAENGNDGYVKVTFLHR